MVKKQALDLMSVLLALAALGAAAVVVYDATRVERTYASAYDVTDPLKEGCSDSSGGGSSTKLINRPTPVRDAEDRLVGRLEIVYSIYCGTAWPRLQVTRDGRTRFRGRSVRLAIERTSDHATAAYVLPLRGGPGGWGNMIAQQDSCVAAEAELLDTGAEPGGPLAMTECVAG
jgi:hypothetical protein